MKKARSEGIAPELLAQLETVAALPEDQIDTTDPDAPEVRDWTGAVQGRFYKPRKQLTSLRLDADVLAFFQATGPRYQTRINRALRAAMLRELRRRKSAPQKDGRAAKQVAEG